MSYRSASCCCRLADVALTVGRGVDLVIDRYLAAFGKKKVQHTSAFNNRLSPSSPAHWSRRLVEFESVECWTKSLDLKCSEYTLEYFIGTKSLRGFAHIHLSRISLSCRGNAWNDMPSSVVWLLYPLVLPHAEHLLTITSSKYNHPKTADATDELCKGRQAWS